MQFDLYRDPAGEYRWRLVAPDGKVVADSGEGYPNKTECIAGIDAFKHEISRALVVEVG